jgi:hypothetical protein
MWLCTGGDLNPDAVAESVVTLLDAMRYVPFAAPTPLFFQFAKMTTARISICLSSSSVVLGEKSGLRQGSGRTQG